jgi:two-component system sensor kinase FixL
MSETISTVSTCPSDQEPAALERENQRLQEENERLLRELGEQAQERLRAQQKQAEIGEELAHFAFVVSHDLKAPLRGIRLISEWLCEDYGDKLGPEAKEQIALLQNRVNRVHGLVDGVLQYSRIGRIKENPVAVNLNELLPLLVETVAPPAHIRIALAPNLPTLTCEKTRIIQVFQHLLTNAVKFMDKSRGQIDVSCVEEAGHWRFAVADNGPGIDAKHFERIFRLFQTLASKEEQESAGVGLTLVKKIVELYGGKIWVESEVGRGSTFYFTFPKTVAGGS